MGTPDRPIEPSLDTARERLKSLRNRLLVLHKALLDSERTSYELVHGKIAGPMAFFRLVTEDNWFSWLGPITKLVVQIDDRLAAKRPPAQDRELEQLITDTQALLSPSRDEEGFWGRYAAVVDRDPAVAVLHEEITRSP